MQLTTENVNGIAVVTVSGDHLDASNVNDFKREMKIAIGTSIKVVLDIAALKFVDSSGLGAILSCLRQLNASNGDLKLCNMSKQVRILFELVRMHRILEVFNTRQDALAAFGK